jgi:hypothetical protein
MAVVFDTSIKDLNYIVVLKRAGGMLLIKEYFSIAFSRFFVI